MATASASTLRNRLLSRARLRHLHVFVKVAELRTVKRAAEAVGVTQPSATQALADLERLLDCALFLRHAQGMTPTAAGTLLLPLARRALGLVDEVATQAAALARGSHEVVRVAATSAAIGGHLGCAIPAFVDAHPGVLVDLQEADVARQAALVADGEVDCAFCRAPAVLPTGWSFMPLWPDRFAIVAGREHPLASQRRVSRRELEAATWLVTPASIVARQAFDAFFADAAEPVKTYAVVTSSTAMMWSLLSQERLLAFIPASVMRGGLELGLLRELAWPRRFPFADIGLLVPQDGGGPALARFVAFIARHARTASDHRA